MAKKKKEEQKSVPEKKKEKNTKQQEKMSLINRIRNFVVGVKAEWKRVKWPTKKNMLKYSIATIVFIVSCSLFFYIIDIVLAFFHTLGK